MIAIIDYDAGNLRSVEKAFQYLGASPIITRDPACGFPWYLQFLQSAL